MPCRLPRHDAAIRRHDATLSLLLPPPMPAPRFRYCRDADDVADDATPFSPFRRRHYFAAALFAAMMPLRRCRCRHRCFVAADAITPFSMLRYALMLTLCFDAYADSAAIARRHAITLTPRGAKKKE